ncbi:MAG: flagellar basal body-associated FliL family protein [Deltaproteobacteria bacterium]|nr:flagellar basal body-associated FliL family protein [Deltaproteobacteria bacterium]
MAEKEKDEREKDDEAEKTEEAPKRKKVPINIIIIVILGLCLAGGGVFVWKSGLFSKDAGDLDTDTENKNNELIGPILTLDTFIVNLIGERGKNYLKAKVELELDSERTTEEIYKRLPQIRDAILTLLSSKSNEDINTLDGKYQLRAEIMTSVNQFLRTGKIKNVYFTDFIIQ